MLKYLGYKGESVLAGGWDRYMSGDPRDGRLLGPVEGKLEDQVKVTSRENS